jgi:hypothetical protein
VVEVLTEGPEQKRPVVVEELALLVKLVGLTTVCGKGGEGRASCL